MNTEFVNYLKILNQFVRAWSQRPHVNDLPTSFHQQQLQHKPESYVGGTCRCLMKSVHNVQIVIK